MRGWSDPALPVLPRLQTACRPRGQTPVRAHGPAARALVMFRLSTAYSRSANRPLLLEAMSSSNASALVGSSLQLVAQLYVGCRGGGDQQAGGR